MTDLSSLNAQKLTQLFFAQLRNQPAELVISEDTPLQAIAIKLYKDGEQIDCRHIFYPTGGRVQTLTGVRQFLNDMGALIVPYPTLTSVDEDITL